VHGGATDHRCFDPIRDLFAQHYTVTAYDRRGRGMIGDGHNYSLDREAADVMQAATVIGMVRLWPCSPTPVERWPPYAVTTRPAPVRALVAYEAPLRAVGMIPAATRSSP
jgi:hypothetical protein